MAEKKSNDFIRSVVVLGAICLIIAFTLAAVNSLASPVIAAGKLERANAARIELLPAADSFVTLTAPGAPSSVTEISRAENGSGYVITVVVDGYGGEMTVMCGIDADGLITNTKVLSHSETKGLGSKVTEAAYSTQYVGKDSALSDVDAISGATVSSKAYYGAISDAFKAYARVKEAE